MGGGGGGGEGVRWKRRWRVGEGGGGRWDGGGSGRWGGGGGGRWR